MAVDGVRWFLTPMRRPSSPRRARFLRRCLAFAALAGSAGASAGVGVASGPNQLPYRICDNPETGKLWVMVAVIPGGAVDGPGGDARPTPSG
ncbi:MAG: hypothetical protein ABI193_20200 [Minicystis sp.]